MADTKDQLAPPKLKKEPAKLRKPIDGHILLAERGRHCLYFNELPLMSHSLCCGGGLWPPCVDFSTCSKKPARPSKDLTWFAQVARRRGA